MIGFGIFKWQQTNYAVFSDHEKMVALGDSLTHGVGEKFGNGYVDDLERYLEQKKNAFVQVDNYGIPNQRTDGLLDQMKQPELKQDVADADYILLFIGTNDLIDSNGGDLYEINEDKIDQGQESYSENLEAILEKLRNANSEAPILLLGLYNPYPDSKKIDEIMEDWNAESKKIVDDYERTKFIATNDIFKEKSTEYFSDALHPNKKGYQLIARKIVKEYDF